MCQNDTITSTASQSEGDDELVGGRQAMSAQTLLLVQSLKSLFLNDDPATEEDIAADTLQHLEILSELMAEVDAMEGGQDGTQHVVTSCTSVSATEPKGDGTGTDLLQYELAQDDSMEDLIDDKDHNALNDLHLIPLVANNADGAHRAETASPIQLVVEQTYSRCQALERERCDLINVTLDLLSASREANKAEIDAALASARRKASEEMIAMQKQTQAQVDQFWFRLCGKCRQNLMHGV
jgi:hypothetical protein